MCIGAMSQTIYPHSQWRFNEDVSNVFDDHVRKSVPHYESIQHLVAQLSDFFTQPNGLVYDIGCATGETVRHIHERHTQKKIRFIGIDESEAMLQKAIEKNKNAENIQFVQQSIERFDFEEKSNMVLSILTLQFVPVEERAVVVKKVYDSLQKGGAFVFVEKTYPSHSKLQEVFTQLYHDMKEQQGLTPGDIRKKDKSLRGVMHPLTESENRQLLHTAGFSTIDIFFKHLQFTGFIAIK